MSSAEHTSTHQGRLRTRVAVFVCVAAVLIAADQVAKYFAEKYLGGGQVHTVIPRVLSLRLLYNPGASLGMGSGSTWVISLAAIAACIVLILLMVRTTSLAWCVALALAFAGAGGNLIDRITNATGFLNGTVVDFLDYGWSVGNVADVYLTLAAAMIIILVLVSVPFSVHKDQPSKDE